METEEHGNGFILARPLGKWLGLSTATLSKWRSIGRGPAGWIHLNATQVAYPWPEVEKWLLERAAAGKPLAVGLKKAADTRDSSHYHESSGVPK